MKSKLTILFAGALAFSLTSCKLPPHRQIVSTRQLTQGSVPAAVGKPEEIPAHCVQLWSSDNPQHGCDVTISFQGTEQVEAHLEYVSPADSSRSGASLQSASSPPAPETNLISNLIMWPLPDSPNPYSTRRVGEKRAAITLQNVTEVRLVCGDPAHPQPGECAYTIEEVDCSRHSDQVYITRVKGDSLARAVEPCCTGRKTLWTAPVIGGKTNLCNVSALLHGSKFCPARVWTADALGNITGFQFAGEAPNFVTFRDTAKIEFECGSPIDKGGGQCVIDILQTECDR